MDLIQDFLYGKEPRSQQQYSNCFKRFLSYIKEQGYISEGELPEQATQFLQKAKEDEGWAQQQVINFIIILGQRKEKKIEAATIKNYYKVVKAFCELHKINLEWPRIKRYIGKVKKIANDRAPSLEEIKSWMEYDDRRIKFVILVTSSCGMRIGAWSYLRWKHVEPIRRDGKIVAAKLTIYAGECEEYITFITPEAYEALDKWMKLREQHGEKIRQTDGDKRSIRKSANTSDRDSSKGSEDTILGR